MPILTSLKFLTISNQILVISKQSALYTNRLLSYHAVLSPRSPLLVFVIFFHRLSLPPRPLPLSHWKTVRKVYQQRSHVSQRLAQCVAVFVVLCTVGCAVGVRASEHATSPFHVGVPCIPLHFLIGNRLSEKGASPRGAAGIPFLWINPCDLNCSTPQPPFIHCHSFSLFNTHSW